MDKWKPRNSILNVETFFSWRTHFDFWVGLALSTDRRNCPCTYQNSASYRKLSIFSSSIKNGKWQTKQSRVTLFSSKLLQKSKQLKISDQQNSFPSASPVHSVRCLKLASHFWLSLRIGRNLFEGSCCQRLDDIGYLELCDKNFWN